MPHPAFARTFCAHTMEWTNVAVCEPARLSRLHVALPPVPRRHAVAPSRPSCHTHTHTCTHVHPPTRTYPYTQQAEMAQRGHSATCTARGGWNVTNGGRVEITERACGCCQRMCLWLWFGAVPDVVSLHTQTHIPLSTHTHTHTHTHPRQSPADVLWYPCLHTPRLLRRSPYNSVLLGWLVLGPGQFVGSSCRTKTRK